MAQNKYSNIGKKQIIEVINQVIMRVDIIETTLNLFIKYVDKDKEFDKFMKKELGGTNDARTNESDNIRGDNTEDNSNS
jgi:hypothetical protein